MAPRSARSILLPAPANLVFGEPGEVFEEVRVPLYRTNTWDLPIALVTVHDGHRVPACAESFASGLDPRELERSFTRERDWGADAMASTVAGLLGLPSYHRVTTARAFLDCGRPRGFSAQHERGLDTKAVPYSIAGKVTPPDLRDGLLKERCAFGDAFGGVLERTLERSGRRVLDSGALFLAIHTYDRLDANRERAPISLVYRARGKEPVPKHTHREALRDTSDPGLVKRLDRTFREGGIATVHNDPYMLPMGGLEIPALNWMFERAQQEEPDLRPCHPRRRPTALVIEYRKDLLVEGWSTDEGWFQPHGSWKRNAIVRIARATAGAVLEHFAEIDPERFGDVA